MELSECVLGVDIHPGTSSSSKRSTYSIAIACNGRIVDIVENASLERVIRLAWEYKPVAIATDNPFELGKDYQALARVVYLLPPGTRLLWVNLKDGRAVPLAAVAKEHGIEFGDKPSPARTAAILARLAQMGVGKSIVSPSSMTKIIVSRIKGHKKGGMSSNRFKRRARANILRIVKDIKKILDREALDYDLVYRKSGGGLDGALFNVYAPRDRIPPSIKSLTAENVKVIIQPVYRLELSTLESGHKPIIVGIDPGTTTGLAVLDLDGQPVYVASRKGLDRPWIVDTLNKLGKPVIVATDVNPVPDLVKKIASTFKAKLYVPRENVSVALKRDIVQKYVKNNPGSGLDTHERDALAAALLAYRELASKIRHVESYVEKLGLDLPLSRLKMNIIEGMSLSEAVENVISEMMGNPLSESGYRVVSEKKEENEEIRRLKERITQLEWEKRYLEKKLRENEGKVYELEKRIEKISLARKNESTPTQVDYLRGVVNALSLEIRYLNEKLSSLTGEKRKLEKIMEKASRGRVLLVPIFDTIDHWSRDPVIPVHGIIYVRDLSTYTSGSIRQAAESGLTGVLTAETSDMGAPRLLEKEAIPVIALPKTGLNHEFQGNILVIDSAIKTLFSMRKAQLEKELREIEKKELLGVIIEYKESRKKTLERIARENRRGDKGKTSGLVRI